MKIHSIGSVKSVILTFLLFLINSFCPTFCNVGLLQDSSPSSDDKRATKFGIYSVVKLSSNLNHLDADQKKMVKLLIEAGKHMDAMFWEQAYGSKKDLLESIQDKDLKRFAEINYGPWDRLSANKPFVPGTKAKPAGAQFYPTGMTKKEFEKAVLASDDKGAALKGLYTVVRRTDEGKLEAIPYSKEYRGHLAATSDLLKQAAALAKDSGFKKYLLARSKALVTDSYRESDMLWMDMKNNLVDVVIGPIENYEDQLYGYKTAASCYVLIKDVQWSQRLARYATLLPELQKGLPVEAKYKNEKPGSNSDLNAYDVIYYAGDCNSGSKTIAINLPNDEEVQLKKGSRRLQLKNAMRAKFDRILLPISKVLIAEDQQKHITFNAFFSNTMFHEVAHGLGIKKTIDGKNTVREALRESYSSLEEGKADILGLYMVTSLFESGKLTEGQLEDYYITFMTSIFRSVRFGATSAHGKANMIRFNFFKEMGAFKKEANGRYRVNMKRMKKAMTDLTAVILKLQGDGDYGTARRYVDKMGFVGPELQADLDRLKRLGIPVDVVWEQGKIE